jgi:hypothetical protein
MEEPLMSRAKIGQEKIIERDTLFLAISLDTKNASLALLSEGEDQLGTLAVAIPQKGKMVGPPLSSILLGDRNIMIARILAERLAERMRKIALVSVFTKTFGEREAGPILLKLMDKTFRVEEDTGRTRGSPE